MRFLTSVPLSLLALSPLVFPAQVSFHSEPSTSSTTIVDVLGSDPDFHSLFRLLQRARLIPTLNILNDSTFFAPTNDAIERHKSLGSMLNTNLSDIPDNVQEKLRQELFYHLLNYSLPCLSNESNLQVHKTLLFPHNPLDPPPKEPPPWIPIPGGTLGGEPQRLRIASRDEKIWVGTNAFGHGGAQVVKGVTNASNGMVLGIDAVLESPPDLATAISQQKSLSYLRRILTEDAIKVLAETHELTLFLPVDSAWDVLHPMEKLYLESEFAADDLTRIVNMHAVTQKGRVTWSESFDPGVNLTTIDGNKLEIVTTPNKTFISKAELIEPDIYASNGVLHTVSSLLIPPGSFRLTPEKFLLTLNCTSFVSLLHSVDLTSLINDTESVHTILAPSDDVLSLFGGDDLPEKGTEQLKKVLQYHFIPERWSPEKLRHKMLLKTALKEPGLGGGRQVMEIEVTHSKEAGNEIRFGGAGTIGDYVEVNNTLIYFISRPVIPPVDPLQSALPSLHLSTFLAAIFSAALADELKTTPRTTILIPDNKAFERLGLLVSGHLLAASSKQDLRHVILHHTIDEIYYSDSLRNGTIHSFPTRDGSDLRLENDTLTASGGWPGMRSQLNLQNLLTDTGVVHELSDILIPRSVTLTVGKLAKAAKGTTMTTMVTKAGLDWVLNATAPPEGSPWAKLGLDGVGWTLLCPPDEAFNHFNLMALYSDIDQLRIIVSQHLIPSPSEPKTAFMEVVNNNRPISLVNDVTYTTLLSPDSAYGDIVVRETEGQLVLGIKGARGTNGLEDRAKVLSWGRVTSGNGAGGVIAIDRVLLPYQPPWWVANGQPIGAGVIGVILICLFFLGVRSVWNREVDATYEPIDS